MNVKIRYFASMRDRMGRAEDTITVDGDTLTIADLWKQVAPGQPLPTSTLIAVNMEYTDVSQKLKNGDEVAFFPPVTGG